MKVFISWSGKASFQIAKVLKEWIPCVIQNVIPYFSSEDIDKGARWSTDIAEELENASFGILCVTKDNMESKWLNFEAGALSKAIDKSRVCPLLFHLKPSDISDGPLLQFQMANVNKDDIYKIFRSINTSLGDNGLDEMRLEKVFSRIWPEMEKAFNSIQDVKDKDIKQDTSILNNSEILEKMLELLRSQQILLNNPEKIFPVSYFEDLVSMMNRKNDLYVPEQMISRLKIIELNLYNSIENSRREGNGEDPSNFLILDYIAICNDILETLGIIKKTKKVHIQLKK